MSFVCVYQSLSCVQLFVTPTVCSLAGSWVHGILQARILEWVAIPSSRACSWSRDWTQVSCIAGRFFTMWASRSPVRKGLCKQQSLDCRWLQGHPFFSVASEWHVKADRLFRIMTEGYTCKGSFLPTVCLKTPLMPPNTHTHTYTVWFKSEQLCEVNIFQKSCRKDYEKTAKGAMSLNSLQLSSQHHQC